VIGRFAATIALLVATLCVPDLGAQRPQVRRCLAELTNNERGLVRDAPLAGNENWFAGGNVKLRCQRQNVHLGGDSLESYNGQVIRLLIRAYYRDDDIDIKADSLIYTKADERIQFRGNVVIVNSVNGSTLTGPSVDYFRPVKAIGRDSAEMTAVERPTVEYKVARTAGDTADPAPYVIVGDRLRGYGSSQMFGWGNVTIDRDSLRGRGDSVKYFTALEDVAVLFGAPATMRRVGADSFRVAGNEVRLGIQGEELRTVWAYGDGEVTSAGGDVRGDSVALAFDDGKLSRTDAWDRTRPASVLAQGYDIKGDSVVIVSPGERIRELLVVGNGVLIEPLDSLAIIPSADTVSVPDSTRVDTMGPVRNTMTGDRITAQFMDWDSAGTPVTRLVNIIAIGNASSLFSRQVTKGGETSPTINYTRADTITVVMKTGDSTGVAVVRATGAVDGMQLERASQRPATSPPPVAKPEDGP
jgi:hypothetical protein